jgi:hypothetical protein
MKTLATGVVVVLAAVTLSAQSEPKAVDPIKARQKISMMEGTLERAIQNGADNLFRQMRASMPPGESPRLSAPPEVRGFRLDGFGVFFDVEVPDLMLPMSWSLRYMMDQSGMTMANAVGELRAVMTQVPDTQWRQRGEQALTRVEMQVGGAGQPRQRLASNVSQTSSAVAAPLPQAAPVDPGTLANPDEEYTKEVKSALIEAMLENSGAIAIGPEESLAVAARNSRGDRFGIAADPSDAQTIMLSIKGSDLAAFHEKRISFEEARKRVQVRQD